MRKNITEKNFMVVAEKYRQDGIMRCLKERGQVLFSVDRHTICRAEKNEDNIVLSIQPRKGWKDDVLAMIKNNSFVNELIENCEC